MQVRISDIAEWATCEVRAHHLAKSGPSGPPSVAAYVGTLAHLMLRDELQRDGGSSIDLPDPPERITYDGLTLTRSQAIRCARDLAREGKRALDSVRFQYLAGEEKIGITEVAGHFDLLGYVPPAAPGEEPRLTLIEFKTTRQTPQHAWLQLGGYAKVLRNVQRRCATLNCLGLLHVPRRAGASSGTLQFRAAEKCIQAYNTVFSRQVLVGAGDCTPIYRPGHHCSQCGLADSCPVAAVQRGSGVN